MPSPMPSLTSPFSSDSNTLSCVLILRKNLLQCLATTHRETPNMILPLFQKVRYTPLTDNSWPRRPNYVAILKYSAIALVSVLLLLAGLQFSRTHRVLLSSPDEGGPPPPTTEPEEGFLSVARGPDILVPDIPQTFEVVAVVFYGRRSRVQILDCYLKVHHVMTASSRRDRC